MDEVKNQWKSFFENAGVDVNDASKYADIFIAQKATMSDLLLELNERHLVNMGITSVFDQIRILSQIKKLYVQEMKKTETTTAAGISGISSDTIEDLFTIHGYSKPTNYGEAMLLIGLLLAKLNVDEGILSAVYCRSVLEEFKKNFLLNYLPARTKKTAEVLREAYQKFYNDTLNAGSRHVRECLKINGTDFAENCLTMYKKASDLIHTVAELYKKHRTLDGIRKLLQDLPKSGEMERACLTAIVTLPSPSTAAVQGGPINFATYYGD